MANAQLFQSLHTAVPLHADTLNHEGAPAYALPARHQLAQYAAIGCLNATFYASAEDQSAFIAQTAVYCRERGYMKDMPALLLAVLAGRGAPELTPAFERVVDNGKMLRNFVQIMRSGAAGRKSLGSRPKKLGQTWLNRRKVEADLVIFVSDNESWIDARRSGATATMQQWDLFKRRNPLARLVCIDVTPHATTQAPGGADILNVGGFSDDVFKIVSAFAGGQLDAAQWVGAIADVPLASA